MKCSRFIQVEAFMFVSEFNLMSYALSSIIGNLHDNIPVKIPGETIDAQITRTPLKQDDEELIVNGLARRLKEGRQQLSVGRIDRTISDEQEKVIGQVFTKSSSEGGYLCWRNGRNSIYNSNTGDGPTRRSFCYCRIP